MRAATVLLRGPKRPGGRLEAERLNVVEVREMNPSEGVEAIHWVLLTKVAVRKPGGDVARGEELRAALAD